ncbi:MAG: PDZ domain-containing protein [Candidatus Obscuribacter sp.]|nr:PDZ domain-containing protein [Candidatus Obscuribacter sp.]
MKLRMLREHCGRIGALLCSHTLKAIAVTALALTLSLNSGAVLADGNAKPAAPAVPTVTAVVPFDGKPIYMEAMNNLLRFHRDLVDTTVRAAFKATWEHKHDNDTMFTTEEGTNKAIFEMMWSLGQRFDYYNPPARATTEKERFNATLAGVGMPVGIKNLTSSLKALADRKKAGETITDDQFKALYKISDERPLWVPEDTFEGGPAKAAGIIKGDIILAVDGVTLNGKTTDDAVKLIRGTPGSKVTLKIKRIGEFADSSITVTVTRAQVQVHAVTTRMLPANISRISMSHFGSQFGDREMAQALARAVKAKSPGIILDLRGNPGGLLTQVISIGQMMIENGIIVQQVSREGDEMVTETYSVDAEHLIYTTESTSGKKKVETYNRNYPVIVPAEVPIVVLIDGGSASASEILAGTLQSNKRALVVGMPTLGKGVGQTVVPMDKGRRNIHVTNFEFLPGGVKMDWVGVIPDVEVAMPDFADPAQDPASDKQLVQAQTELLNLFSGGTAPVRDPAEVAKRKDELLKSHKDDFQQEIDGRKKFIAEPLKPAGADKSDDE